MYIQDTKYLSKYLQMKYLLKRLNGWKYLNSDAYSENFFLCLSVCLHSIDSSMMSLGPTVQKLETTSKKIYS